MKIPGKINPVDLMTKFLHVKNIIKNLSLLRITWAEGNKSKRETKMDKGKRIKARLADADEEGDETNGEEEKLWPWWGK